MFLKKMIRTIIDGTLVILVFQFILYTLLFTSIRFFVDLNQNNSYNQQQAQQQQTSPSTPSSEYYNYYNYYSFTGSSGTERTGSGGRTRRNITKRENVEEKVVIRQKQFYLSQLIQTRRRLSTTSSSTSPTKPPSRRTKKNSPNTWDILNTLIQNLLVDKELYAQKSSLQYMSDLKLPPLTIWYQIFKQMIGARPEDYVYDLIWPSNERMGWDRIRLGMLGMVYAKVGYDAHWDGYKMPSELVSLHVPPLRVTEKLEEKRKRFICKSSNDRCGIQRIRSDSSSTRSGGGRVSSGRGTSRRIRNVQGGRMRI